MYIQSFVKFRALKVFLIQNGASLNSKLYNTAKISKFQKLRANIVQAGHDPCIVALLTRNRNRKETEEFDKKMFPMGFESDKNNPEIKYARGRAIFRK